MLGFCEEEEKLAGPVHEYVAPANVCDCKLKVWPAHRGEFAATVGVAGIGFTVTATVPEAPGHPATVAKTEYVPVAAVVAPESVGFCKDEEKLFGPLQL